MDSGYYLGTMRVLVVTSQGVGGKGWSLVVVTSQVVGY